MIALGAKVLNRAAVAIYVFAVVAGFSVALSACFGKSFNLPCAPAGEHHTVVAIAFNRTVGATYAVAFILPADFVLWTIAATAAAAIVTAHQSSAIRNTFGALAVITAVWT